MGSAPVVSSSRAWASLRLRITPPTVSPVVLKIRFTVRTETPCSQAMRSGVIAMLVRCCSMKRSMAARNGRSRTPPEAAGRSTPRTSSRVALRAATVAAGLSPGSIPARVSR